MVVSPYITHNQVTGAPYNRAEEQGFTSLTVFCDECAGKRNRTEDTSEDNIDIWGWVEKLGVPCHDCGTDC